MSEERLKEIKDMIDSDYDFCRSFGIDFAVPEKELELYNEVIRLQKRNKEIYDGFMATQEELSDYAIRIDKAIEYIEKHNASYENMIHQKINYLELTDDEYDELLNILKGE